MTTDERIKAALHAVGTDVSARTDDEIWAGIKDRVDATSNHRAWRRPIVLTAAAATVIAIILGLVTVAGDEADTSLDVVEDGVPTTTDPDPAPVDPEPDDGSTDSTVRDTTPTDPDEIFVDEATRPLVVVSQSGHQVTAYFSGGRDPITYDSDLALAHAEIGPDGTLWVTVAPDLDPEDDGGRVEETKLLNIDPETGDTLSQIDRAGYASVSPDGTQMAFVRHQTEDQPAAVIIRALTADSDGSSDDYELPANPRNDVQSSLWALDRIQWSPDGSRILVNEVWEDDIMWLVDLSEHDFVNEGTALSIAGADWISDTRLLATAYCCYAEPETTPRHLVEVDLTTTPEPTIIDRDERSAALTAVVPSGGLETAVHIVGDTFDSTGTLVRLETGDVIAENVVSVQW